MSGRYRKNHATTSLIARRRDKAPVVRHKSADPGDYRTDGEDGRSCPNSPAVKKSIRLVVVGSPNTGKTAILARFFNEDFSPSYCPTVENFHRKMYRIRGDLYQLDILDTGGNNAFPASRRLQLLTGDLFVVVCSLDSESSFEEALSLRSEIRDLKTRPGDKTTQDTIPILIALNKTDLPNTQWEITIKACDEKVEEIGVLFPCSAKTGAGINGIFATLFVVAKLPKQMLPQQHVFLGPRSSDCGLDPCEEPADTHSPLTRLKSRRFKDKNPPVSYKELEPRRPSLRSDLLVLRAKTSLPTTALLVSDRPLSARTSQSPTDRRCALM